MTLVGNKSDFAIECKLNTKEKNSGNIFLYIDGVRFGQKDFYEELGSFFLRLNDEIKTKPYESDILFNLNVDEIINLINCIYDDFSIDGCSKYIGIVRNEDEFLRKAVYSLEYAFDSVLICIIRNGNKEKLFLKDGGILKEKILKKDQFINFFKKLEHSAL